MPRIEPDRLIVRGQRMDRDDLLKKSAFISLQNHMRHTFGLKGGVIAGN